MSLARDKGKTLKFPISQFPCSRYMKSLFFSVVESESSELEGIKLDSSFPTLVTRRKKSISIAFVVKHMPLFIVLAKDKSVFLDKLRQDIGYFFLHLRGNKSYLSLHSSLTCMEDKRGSRCLKINYAESDLLTCRRTNGKDISFQNFLAPCQLSIFNQLYL